MPSQLSPEAKTKACPVEVLPGGPWGAWQGGPSVCAGISAHEVEGLVEPTRSVELLPLGDPQKRPSALRGQSAEGRVVVATQFQECSWRRGDAAHGNGITSRSLATHTSNKETLATRGARQLAHAGNRGEAHSPENLEPQSKSWCEASSHTQLHKQRQRQQQRRQRVKRVNMRAGI